MYTIDHWFYYWLIQDDLHFPKIHWWWMLMIMEEYHNHWTKLLVLNFCCNHASFYIPGMNFVIDQSIQTKTKKKQNQHFHNRNRDRRIVRWSKLRRRANVWLTWIESNRMIHRHTTHTHQYIKMSHFGSSFFCSYNVKHAHTHIYACWKKVPNLSTESLNFKQQQQQVLVKNVNIWFQGKFFFHSFHFV